VGVVRSRRRAVGMSHASAMSPAEIARPRRAAGHDHEERRRVGAHDTERLQPDARDPSADGPVRLVKGDDDGGGQCRRDREAKQAPPAEVLVHGHAGREGVAAHHVRDGLRLEEHLLCVVPGEQAHHRPGCVPHGEGQPHHRSRAHPTGHAVRRETGTEREADQDLVVAKRVIRPRRGGTGRPGRRPASSTLSARTGGGPGPRRPPCPTGLDAPGEPSRRRRGRERLQRRPGGGQLRWKEGACARTVERAGSEGEVDAEYGTRHR
jgi:hypothetical protein